VLAGKPANQAALAEVGRLFGRIAHLLDAVEDLAADRASGAWNPLAATGADVAEARRLCDDALLGIRLALAEAEFAEPRLVKALLIEELGRSVRRTFAHAGGITTAKRIAVGGIAVGSIAATGIGGAPWLRRRRPCCGPCDDCCCESGCEGCCEGCGDCDCCGACCDGCDCSC